MKRLTLSPCFNPLAAVALSSTLFGCASSVAPESVGTTSSADSSDELPPVPAALAVPDGNRLAFHLDAVGVQIYTCTASGTGTAWTVAPKANLYDRGGEIVAIHYKGPTWQWLEDGSTVVGAKLAAYTPDPTAIPWLLLHAVSHSGQGRMTSVSFVQRLETTGGLGPSGACDAVGSTVSSPYTATYAFYRPDHDDGDHGDSEPDRGHDDGQDDSP